MFNIQYLGSNFVHEGDFSLDRPRGLGSYLLLYVRTKARFRLRETETIVDPDTWILLSPHTPHFYSDIDGYYVDDWIHFDSTEPIPECLCDRFIHIGGVVQVDLYVRLICDAHFRGAGSQVESQLMQAMMDDVRSMVDTHAAMTGHGSRLLELRKLIYAAPHLPWTIKSMSEQLMLSAPYFQAQYKNAFGIAPMADVIAGRIELAKKYLLTSNMSISEIAEKCGYGSSVHFARQFSTHVGMPPTAFRAQNQ